MDVHRRVELESWLVVQILLPTCIKYVSNFSIIFCTAICVVVIYCTDPSSPQKNLLSASLSQLPSTANEQPAPIFKKGKMFQKSLLGFIMIHVLFFTSVIFFYKMWDLLQIQCHATLMCQKKKKNDLSITIIILTNWLSKIIIMDKVGPVQFSYLCPNRTAGKDGNWCDTIQNLQTQPE